MVEIELIKLFLFSRSTVDICYCHGRLGIDMTLKSIHHFNCLSYGSVLLRVTVFITQNKLIELVLFCFFFFSVFFVFHTVYISINGIFYTITIVNQYNCNLSRYSSASTDSLDSRTAIQLIL